MGKLRCDFGLKDGGSGGLFAHEGDCSADVGLRAVGIECSEWCRDGF